MKLVRFGAIGAEKPGILDAEGQIRDLSAHIDDINGAALSAASLDKLRAIDIASLPVVSQDVRLGACVGGIGKFMCCLLYTSPSPRDVEESRMPSSA